MQFCFKPKIDGYTIKNGLICIIVNNVEDYYKQYVNLNYEYLNLYNNFFTTKTFVKKFRIWQLEWRILHIHEWNFKKISYNEFYKDKNRIFIRIPVHLYPVNIEFRIKAQHIILQQWSEYSNILKLVLQSFNFNNSYKLGDNILFYFKNKYFLQNGKITKVLKNNFYQIKYEFNFKQNCDVIYDVHNLQYNEKYIILASSEIFLAPRNIIRCISIPNQSFLNGLNENDKFIYQIIKCEIIKLLKNEIISINCNYQFVCDCNNLNFIASVSNFVTKNILMFLYDKYIIYKLNCLLNHNHKECKYQNVRQLDLSNQLDFFKFENNNTNLQTLKILQCIPRMYHCNLCTIQLNIWDNVHQCKYIQNNSIYYHHYCCDCIDVLLKLHNQLSKILENVLKKYFIRDIILIITDLVFGYIRLQVIETKPIAINKRNIILIDDKIIKKRRID